MAELILAEMRLGRGVTKLAVLKLIWPELAADPDFVSLFLHEARVGARMNHPNVVQTYEVVEDAERPAMAMEYLDGQALTRVLNRLVGTGMLSAGSRLGILTSVLAGLDYAHELTDYDGAPHGIVHRDVNPQNVFVTYNGQVKLIDFGVAKSLGNADQTRPGSMKGKLAYMAPEQILGGKVDRRADVFAVGVMLWEMAAGRRLWRGKTEGEIIGHLTSRLAMPEIPADSTLPRDLDKICARALSLDPDQRHATAAELESDLARFLPRPDNSDARHLGKVVSLAFAEERAARHALIDEYVRRAHESSTPVPVESIAAPAAEPAPLPPMRPLRATPFGLWSPIDQPQSRRRRLDVIRSLASGLAVKRAAAGLGLAALVVLVSVVTTLVVRGRTQEPGAPAPVSAPGAPTRASVAPAAPVGMVVVPMPGLGSRTGLPVVPAAVPAAVVDGRPRRARRASKADSQDDSGAPAARLGRLGGRIPVHRQGSGIDRAPETII